MTDSTRSMAAAAIAAQAGDLRTGHDSPVGYLVAELDAARQQVCDRDQLIERLRGRVDELEARLGLIDAREDREFDRELAAARDAWPDAPEVAS